MIEHVIILAAGKGKRMASSISKPCHDFAGKPMIRWCYEAALACNPTTVHVVHNRDNQAELAHSLQRHDVNWVLQDEQCGTADALSCVLAQISDGHFLMLYADMPLICHDDLKSLVAGRPQLALIANDIDDPTGYGRLIRDDKKHLKAIIEEADAAEEQKAIRTVFTGVMTGAVQQIKHWLKQVDTQNAQREKYLTQLIALAYADDMPAQVISVQNEIAYQGINTIRALIELQRSYFLNRAYAFIDQGVKIIDPARFECRGEVSIGHDTEIRPNVSITGPSQIGAGCLIAEHVVLDEVSIEDRVNIHANSVLHQVNVAAFASIGPFAYCRNGTQVAEHAQIGAFVEAKKTVMGQYAKAKHLSYLGDATIGQHTNIGAGVIICNWDGQKKHQTIIGDYVFVGSDSQLIAPIKIEQHAFIAAGSCINKDIPSHHFAIGRSKQVVRMLKSSEKEKA